MNKFHTWSIEPGSLEYPLVIAHRGGSDLAPENTIAAFRKAMGVGADEVEMDVRLTKDKEVVVLHDRRLDRFHRQGKSVAAWNWDVRALEALSGESKLDAVVTDSPLETFKRVSGLNY